MDIWKLLLDVVLLLAVCMIFGGIASWLKQSPLIGYLLAGMLVGGPGSAKLLALESEIEVIAELGVSLLLFSLGLEFSWQRLRALGTSMLLGGVMQIVLTATLAAGVCTLLGVSMRAAIAIGAMVSLSSTACCLRVLIDRAELDSVHGRVALAVLLVQDLAVVPFAILMNLLHGDGALSHIALDVGKTVGLAAVLVVVMYFALNLVAVRVLGLFTQERNRELVVLLAVVTGLGATWAAHSVGLSPALGAFGAGLFLGGSRFATLIRADVSSLRTLLLTLFFGSAGMAADPRWIATHLPLVIGVSAGIVIGKAVVVWVMARIIRLSDAAGVSAGLSLGQIGEFAFVLGSTAVAGGVIAAETYALIVSCAIVTLLITPTLVSAAPHVGMLVQRGMPRRIRGTAIDPTSAPAHHPDVILIGFGPAGEHVGRILAECRIPATVIDLSERSRRAADALGLSGQVGDATQEDVLEHAGIDRAKLVVITLPDRYAALTVLSQVRNLAPQAHVITRCRYDRHRSEFDEAGAHEIVQDEQQAGQELAQRVRERATALCATDLGNQSADTSSS
ncbi:MAG: cation:proton antiporter [Phycisphaerales bacterium]|nr:cation:proton antiporter [Phycisphaerales bacterium]